MRVICSILHGLLILCVANYKSYIGLCFDQQYFCSWLRTEVTIYVGYPVSKISISTVPLYYEWFDHCLFSYRSDSSNETHGMYDAVQIDTDGNIDSPVNLYEISTASGSSIYFAKHSNPFWITKPAHAINKAVEKVQSKTFWKVTWSLMVESILKFEGLQSKNYC